MSKFVRISIRRKTKDRAQGLCEYCLCPESYSTSTFECEHIQPSSLDGTSDINNLAWACGGCNRIKSNRTSVKDIKSGRMVALYNPRQDVWEDHFKWSHNWLELIGLTPCGRATIEWLQLNRPGVKNMRSVLILVGKHPPRIQPQTNA